MPEPADQETRKTVTYRDSQIVVEARLEDLGGTMVFFAQWTIIKGAESRRFSQSAESYPSADLALQAAEEHGSRDVDLRLKSDGFP
jgi:hypothetical protein